VKNTQQKSSATFLQFFEKSAKNSAAVSSSRRDFYKATFAFSGRNFGQLATLKAGNNIEGDHLFLPVQARRYYELNGYSTVSAQTRPVFKTSHSTLLFDPPFSHCQCVCLFPLIDGSVIVGKDVHARTQSSVVDPDDF
jgi:hypothetical protein